MRAAWETLHKIQKKIASYDLLWPLNESFTDSYKIQKKIARLIPIHVCHRFDLEDVYKIQKKIAREYQQHLQELCENIDKIQKKIASEEIARKFNVDPKYV